MGDEQNPTNSSGTRLLEVLDRSVGHWSSRSLRMDGEKERADLHKVRHWSTYKCCCALKCPTENERTNA